MKREYFRILEWLWVRKEGEGGRVREKKRQEGGVGMVRVDTAKQ
jgi:hypothetical protein